MTHPCVRFVNKQFLSKQTFATKGFYLVAKMQDYEINNNTLTSNMLKSKTVDHYYPQDKISRHNNFMHGLQNARNILNDLQESLATTRKYENQLMRCRSKHAHDHEADEWLCGEEFNDEELNDKKSQTKLRTRSATGLGSESQYYGDPLESWSTMSIVCLQYQYEELSKRYKSLLEEYDERCGAANTKDKQLGRLQELARSTHAQLMDAHTMLLAVGERYMSLRERKHAQKHVFAKKVHILKKAVKELISAADRARQELDSKLTKAMKTERHGAAAMLLAEIQKCNYLCLENLRLKAQIQDLIPRNDARYNYDY